MSFFFVEQKKWGIWIYIDTVKYNAHCLQPYITGAATHCLFQEKQFTEI